MKDTLTYDFIEIDIGVFNTYHVHSLEGLISILSKMQNDGATEYSIYSDDDEPGFTITTYTSRPMTEEEKLTRDKMYEEAKAKKEAMPKITLKSLYAQHSQ